MNNPILQFGTSRFLQAHADLFISEALQRGDALGHITIVQTTDNPGSARRIDAFNRPGGYTVHIRGWQDGVVVSAEQRVTAVTEALQASRDWARIRADVAGGAKASSIKVILSNTGDAGYALAPGDHAGLLGIDVAPRSFPAKLLVLLHGRFLNGGALCRPGRWGSQCRLSARGARPLQQSFSRAPAGGHLSKPRPEESAPLRSRAGAGRAVEAGSAAAAPARCPGAGTVSNGQFRAIGVRMPERSPAGAETLHTSAAGDKCNSAVANAACPAAVVVSHAGAIVTQSAMPSGID